MICLKSFNSIIRNKIIYIVIGKTYHNTKKVLPISLSKLTFLPNKSILINNHHLLHSTKSRFESCHNDFWTPISSLSEIKLTDDESELINMFKSIVSDEKLSTTVRIAGGWVRDKLLGQIGKDDIDVVLDNMTGREFSDLLNIWIEKKGFKSVCVAIIQLNPDKSKHLETATAQLGKFSVDFVNMRTESYSNNSRIPIIEIGTPLSDATRRDLTINSLFYNINTMQVEDFTGQGLNDLKSRIIRTPLPALVTLKDDPLRCLRVIRFACRLNFRIHKELSQACADIEVKSIMETKVSKERVYIELELMFKSNSSFRAAYLLYSYNLYDFLFLLSNSIENGKSKEKFVLKNRNNIVSTESVINYQFKNSFYSKGILSVLINDYILRVIKKNENSELSNYNNIIETFVNIEQNGEAWKLLTFSLLTSQAENYGYFSTKAKHVPLAEHILQKHLKMKNKDVDSLLLIQNSRQAFHNLLIKVMNSKQSVEIKENSKIEGNFYNFNGNIGGEYYGPISRLELGLAIREVGDNYPIQLLYTCGQLVLNKVVKNHTDISFFKNIIKEFSILCEIPDNYIVKDNYDNNVDDISDKYKSHIVEVLEAADVIIKAFKYFQLDQVWLEKPMLSGLEIISLFEGSSLPKSSIGEVMQFQINWKICNPEGSTNEMKSFLLSQFKNYFLEK